jgi:DAK2 domain fusion protein YloV
METDGLVEAVPGAAARAPVEGETEWGYCTEFILRGKNLDLEEIKKRISAWGDSALVVGDDSTIKVHVHTFRPGDVVGYASAKGTLHDIKIDNMQDQHREYLVMGESSTTTLPTEEKAADGVAIVAVVSGDGLCRVFNSLGASTIVPGGQTMNPSTQELLEAIEGLSEKDVIVLPNNDNVVLAAEKAKELSQKNVIVVPSETIPQGISALLAFNYQADLERNAQAMNEATHAVQTAEITRAIRSASVNGLKVKEGEFIGLVQGDLTASGTSAEAVALQTLEQMNAAGCEIITAYYGEEVTEDQAKALLSTLQERYPDQEWELITGGQPHYHYILSVE